MLRTVHTTAQVAVVVQVESARGVDEVERIAATPGVDCLFVGPADLAASLGHLGDIRHPDVETAMARVLAAGKQAGVAVGIFAGDTAAARQYRDAGYRMITVSADVAPAGQGAFTVQDNGVGFDPARAGSLFGVFQRLHRETEFEGVGTGLALCRAIAQRHGAQISATAVLGGGCAVRVQWPVSPAAANKP